MLCILCILPTIAIGIYKDMPQDMSMTVLLHKKSYELHRYITTQ